MSTTSSTTTAMFKIGMGMNNLISRITDCRQSARLRGKALYNPMKEISDGRFIEPDSIDDIQIPFLIQKTVDDGDLFGFVDAIDELIKELNYWKSNII